MSNTCRWCGKNFDPANALRGGVINIAYCSKRCETAAQRCKTAAQRSQEAQYAADAAARKEKANKVKGLIKKLWN